MPAIQSYRDLRAWQRAMELVLEVYRVVGQLPREERFDLGSQLRRCSVSIPSNLAEGHARDSRAEFLRFVRISLGSLAELETQLELVRRMELAPEEITARAARLASEVGRMLTALRLRLAGPRMRLPSP